jgi:hypothetical protein
MNLREQIEKEITEKVMTKLASEKVELNLVSDAKTVVKNAQVEFDKLDKAENNYQNAISKFEKIREVFLEADAQTLGSKNRLKKIIAEMDKIKNQFVKTGKDLGIDYKQIAEFKSLEMNLKTANAYEEGATEQSKEIRKFL